VHRLVGGGHKERRWSKVDREEWQRPWQCVRVPSERSVNMEGWSAARASWNRRDVISVPGLAGGGAEGGCRRGGGSGFIGGNGGTVFLRFWPKREQSSMRVGRRASRGGEEALGCWNRDGAGRGGENFPADGSALGLMLVGKKR
jgi:hypothetical protein